MSMSIRRAREADADRLREIAIASKASWGYPADFLARFASRVSYRDGYIGRNQVYLAEQDGTVVAFYAVVMQGEVALLDDLWVEPGRMRQGIGRRLFEHAAAQARSCGALRLEWEAEPNAVGFYERMGGRFLRDSPTTEFGRTLPMMGVDL